MTKYLQVNSVFEYDGTKLKVVPQKYNNPSCAGCFFTEDNRKALGLKPISYNVHNYACTAFGRKDKQHVIFVIQN